MAAVGPPRVGVGHGKLILFGEHAAVYGHPALGIPLDRWTRVEILPGDSPWSLPGLSESDARTVAALLERLDAGPAGGSIHVTSTLPRGAGFGSSAALCVALAAALAGERPPYSRRVWEQAHRAEELFHGTPSGIDTGLSLLEGIRVFHPRPPLLPEESRLPEVALHLVVGATSRRASTGELVSGLRERMKAGDPATRAAVEELGGLASQACDALRGRDSAGTGLGSLADQAQQVLAGLGLSTPETDALLAEGRSIGALGGKLSGAGGGGAFYLVTRDAKGAQLIAQELPRRAARRGVELATLPFPVLWNDLAPTRAPWTGDRG